MDKFKVEYTETRYFTVEVEANNEDDAAERATYIADRDGLFQYKNEDTTVKRIVEEGPECGFRTCVMCLAEVADLSDYRPGDSIRFVEEGTECGYRLSFGCRNTEE